MNISWLDPVELVEHELQQREEEGRDVVRARTDWVRMKESRSSKELEGLAGPFFDQLSLLPHGETSVRVEPSTEKEIFALCPVPRRLSAYGTASVLANRIAGGWFGRAAGCLLGKPVEKIPRQGIRDLLVSGHSWPLSFYFSEKGVPPEMLAKYPWNRHFGKESLRENIVCMPEDDDMNYPMLNLFVLETAGRDFSTDHIAQAWLGMLPVLSTFTAERIAYLNLLEGCSPPKTAARRNPYREWIGAQIRGDVFGWVSPGRPREAAALAFRDARLSHMANGIYGEMFVAAMIAAACVVESPREAVEAGLESIPPESRLAEAVRFSLNQPGTSWESTVDRIYDRYGAYHWVHSVNNAALVAAALVGSGGDYEKAVCNVVMGGWDTDSNGATVGAVMGTLLGLDRIPKRWIDPLHNRIRSSLKGFDNAPIDRLAERTLAIALSTPSLQVNNAFKK